MERVVNVLRNVTENGDTKVEHVVSKQAVMNEKVDVEKLEFAVSEPVTKIGMFILVELGSFGAF